MREGGRECNWQIFGLPFQGHLQAPNVPFLEFLSTAMNEFGAFYQSKAFAGLLKFSLTLFSSSSQLSTQTLPTF